MKVAIVSLILSALVLVLAQDEDISNPGYKYRGALSMAGFQGQSFRLDGESGGVYNMITSPFFQFNAEMTDLSTGNCSQNDSDCTPYTGSFLTKAGFLFADDRVLVHSGTHKEGMRVTINGKKFGWTGIPIGVGESRIGDTRGQNATLELISHHELHINTLSFYIIINNQNDFFSMQIQLKNKQWLLDGRRKNNISPSSSSPSPSLPHVHGLIGQTHKYVVYPGGSVLEGSMGDYKLQSSDLLGIDFKYNLYIKLH